MALDFPPPSGSPYTAPNGVTYVWNGTAWDVYCSGTGSPTPVDLWTENSGKLYPTTITNKVGVGTAAPAYDLQINGDIAATNYRIELLTELT